MKLNNRGFAISTIMYMILIMAVILIVITLALLSNRKFVLDKTKEEAKENIYVSTPKLPIEYQEVMYIESTGTQYINTGLIGKPGYTVEAILAFTKLSTGSYQYFAGYSYTGDPDRTYYIRLNNTTNYLGYTYGEDNSYTDELAKVVEDKFYTIKSVMKSGKQELFLDGHKKDKDKGDEKTPTPTFGALSYNSSSPKYIYMFKSQYINSTTGGMNVKSGAVKWYDENDNLIRHFVPCYRKSDEVIGMLDLIEEKFYTNLGSGTFKKGPDIN